MESNQNALGWVRGLSAYLEFAGDEDSKRFIDFLEQSLYADNPVIDSTNQTGMIEFISILRKFAPNPIFDTFHKYYRYGGDPGAIQDAFSRGQVLSKIWLVQELSKIETAFPTIFLFAGWFGQLRLYLDKAGIKYNHIRNFDIDPFACEMSDRVFNIDKIEKYVVKSSEFDINNLEKLHTTGLEFPVKNYTTGKVFNEKRFPSLVINTSAEHFDEQWYHKIVSKNFPNRPLFVIQSNNLHDIPEHVNTVHSSDELLKKFPMKSLYYKGEIELFGYKRFMLIGRPT